MSTLSFDVKAANADIGYVYEETVSVGGFPTVSLGGRVKYFAAEVEAVNIDIEGQLDALYTNPTPNKDKGSWFAGTATVALGLTPRSTPVNIALGPWLGVVSYDITDPDSHLSLKDTNLAVGGSGAVRLMFGKAREMSIGGVLRLGGVLADQTGTISDLRLTFSVGY